MSQARTAAPLAHYPDHSADDVTVIAAESRVQGLLDVLDDADCRAILDATGDEALSANEVSETCDLPLSTAYRKLDALADAGLVEERTRLRRSGKHASEYARAVEDVVVSLGGDGGVELRVSRRETEASPATPAAESRN